MLLCEVIKQRWHIPMLYSYDLQLSHHYSCVICNVEALDISGQIFQEPKLRF